MEIGARTKPGAAGAPKRAAATGAFAADAG
jgi:hypothetical protein